MLDYSKNASQTKEALDKIPNLGWVRDILGLQKPEGYWESRRSLYRPKYTSTNWRALVLSDFGMTKKDPRIKEIAEQLFSKWFTKGKNSFFGESEVCIVGNTARMLTRFGYGSDPRVEKLFQSLVDSQKDDGGWHCFGGSKGSLDCWEGLAAYSFIPKSKRTRSINRSIARGAEFYLERKLFDDGEEKYLPWFRFHYPFHYYYDILVGLDFLTRLGYANDHRLRPALDTLVTKRRTDGTWLLDRIHPDLGHGAAYGPFKNAPKLFALERERRPSKWITLRARQVLKRVEDAS